MKEIKLVKLQKLIDSTRLEIKRMQGEYDFLWHESERLYAMKLAAMNKSIVENPEFVKRVGPALGEDFIRETIESSKRRLDELPVDKEKLKESFVWIVDLLVDLHRKQIAHYSNLAEEASKEEYVEYVGGDYEMDAFKCSIANSLESHQKMIDIYLGSKTQFFDWVK